LEIPFVLLEVELLELAKPFLLEGPFLANPLLLEGPFFYFFQPSLVLENQSKPQYNLKTKTDHSTLIARTLPLSKTLRDKIPKATMKITDFVKPPKQNPAQYSFL
jgi:hypothetical protein